MLSFFIRYKRILLVVGFIAITIILGYFLYAIFLKPAIPVSPLGPGATTTPGGLPISPAGPGQIVTPTTPAGLPTEITGGVPSPVANGGLTQTAKLGEMSALGAVLSANGSNLQFYNKDDEKFYYIDKDGKTTLLSDKAFHSVEKVIWSPVKSKAIIEYPDGANIVYDFSNKKQTTLPAHWKDFDFSPDGKEIVTKSIGLDPANRWLAVTNEDGSKTRAIEELGENEATVYPSWSPSNQSIAMYTKGVDFDRQEIFFVGLNNENFKSTIVEGRGLQFKWQPSGDRLVYSVYSSKNEMKPMLWTVNAKGESIGSGRRSLNIETWADKCNFANSNDLYCAVPEKLEEGAGLFPEMAKNTRDFLYKIDATTGAKKLIAVPDGAYNMSNIIISSNGNYLYFTDQTTKKLYKINLK